MDRTTPPQHAPTQRLASWHPATVGQWPGHVAAVLELWGCSFACPSCHGLRSQTPQADAPDWSEIVAHVHSHRQMLDSIVVTGGEPLEDPDLPSLLAALAELGLDVCLETNGSRPDVLAYLLSEDLVDFVALDLKTVAGRYHLVSCERDMAARVAESADMLIRSGIEHEFRTTVQPGLVDCDDLHRIARTIRGGRLYALQPYFSGEGSSDAPFTDDDLLAAASSCQRFLPTVVRGLDPEEG